MDAVTYPDSRVVSFVDDNFIPLQVPYNLKPLSSDFNVKWTPTLITLGMDKREHHRTVGFLDPDEFIASGLLGIGKYHFDNDRFAEALRFLERTAADFPATDSAPEAIFLRGVSRYKDTGDPTPLKKTHETLKGRYPASEWTKRAYPYRLL
jgi:hypothetical protein